MADGKLELLESQIESLENRIFGDADKDSAYPKIIDALTNLKRQFVSSVADRKKAGPVLNRIGELNDYLDPDFTEPLMTTQEAKVDNILAEEDNLRETAAYLEKIKDLADVLGNDHIKVVPELEDKLQQLSKIHLQQQDAACEMTDELKDLVSQYNNTMTMISKQLIQWDEIVTSLELRAQPKKTDD